MGEYLPDRRCVALIRDLRTQRVLPASVDGMALVGAPTELRAALGHKHVIAIELFETHFEKNHPTITVPEWIARW